MSAAFAPQRPSRTYNLFSRKRSPGLVCAVPEDRPVPAFLNGTWRFSGRADPAAAPAGFNERAARVGIDAIGFYLFECVREPGAAPKQPSRGR
jgi:hypothetical protein